MYPYVDGLYDMPESNTDTITYLNPDLRLVRNDTGVLDIMHEEEVLWVMGIYPVPGVEEVFNILNALVYSRKDYSDGSFGYWANFRGGLDFFVSGDSLREVVRRAAELIGMHIAGRRGHDVFPDVLDLNGK